MVTDPVADSIIRLQNAGAVGHAQVVLPYSKMRETIMDVLSKAGFVGTVEKQGKKENKTIVVNLLTKADGSPRISRVRRISKPSRRIYRGVKDVHQVRNGVGVLVLSTPQGIMTDKEAREANVGGEALFEIY